MTRRTRWIDAGDLPWRSTNVTVGSRYKATELYRSQAKKGKRTEADLVAYSDQVLEDGKIAAEEIAQRIRHQVRSEHRNAP